jgi:hypothetical protein
MRIVGTSRGSEMSNARAKLKRRKRSSRRAAKATYKG